jgi:predicted GNAT superfamily acetyltransferase
MAPMRLRPYQPGDAEAVLALNQANLDAVGWLDAERLAWLTGMAEACLIADAGGALAGFAVVLAPGTAYDSANYRWFGERFDDFAYLDRIVVAPAYRRTGVGTVIYDAAEEQAHNHGRMTLEVNVDPPNEPSLAFHERRGYGEVGRLRQGNGKTCGMLVKQLPS